jgi:head-tail adaptor
VCSVFASIRPASSREAFDQGQLQGSRTHVVTLRYTSAAIGPSCRVVWGSRTFQITGVRVEDEERRVMLLDCVEERV